MSDGIIALAERVKARLAGHGFMLTTAESCTGGLIAGAITEISGSSAIFDRGFVTYSNAAKMALVGVRAETLEMHGAVSRETAIEMAKGAIAASDADVAVSVTGIAGPSGGSADKPIGLVHMGLAFRGRTSDAREFRFGAIGRHAVREETVKAALSLLLERL